MTQSRRNEETVTRAASTTLAPSPMHTPASLVERHGEADRTTIAGFVWGVSSAELFARGQRIATSRLVTDGAAMLGEASDFMAVATREQRVLLVSITGAFLSAAASALRQAELLDGRRTKRITTQKNRRDAKKVDASRAMSEGRARRDVYRANLITQCGDDGAWKKRIDDACCPVSTLDELADSLDAMAREGRSLVTSLAREKRPSALDAQWFEALTAEATRLRERAKATVGANARLAVRKGEINWWEGVCLWFLKAAYDVFARANAVDPAVPKLTLGGLRSTLVPNQTRKKKVAAKPVPPPVG